MIVGINLNEKRRCNICNAKADWIVVRNSFLLGTRVYTVCHNHRRLIQRYGYYKILKGDFE